VLHYADPTLIVDGEITADDALSPEVIEQSYPFSTLKGGANVLIFPDLASANTAYKLLVTIGGAETIGPIVMGMSRPVHVVLRNAQVEDIVHVAAIAVVDAQENEADVQLRLAERRAEPVTLIGPKPGEEGTHVNRVEFAVRSAYFPDQKLYDPGASEDHAPARNDFIWRRPSRSRRVPGATV
jgi:Phosphate acetyl/butaryl transferase